VLTCSKWYSHFGIPIVNGFHLRGRLRYGVSGEGENLNCNNEKSGEGTISCADGQNTLESRGIKMHSIVLSLSSAARILHKFKLIDYSRGKVTVMDRKGLERAAGECLPDDPKRV
jgi:hypothetical protein